MITCPDCTRFIQADSDSCPFCDHSLVPPRGSILASAVLGLTLAACNGGMGGEEGGESAMPMGDTIPGTAYAGPDVDTDISAGPPVETTANETSTGEGTTTADGGTSTTADGTASGTAGSGTADSGTAGSGTAGSGTAGSSGSGSGG